VFHPVPNVDSVLVVLQRTGEAPEPGLRALVQGAFAHRRKALPRSLELAAKEPRWREIAPESLQPGTGDRSLRERVRAGLAAIGEPEDARAERLTPAQFRALWEQVRAG
jgi:16S rRNA (adenine1518-N6/adenine1519-N6)-dimethyltransferase